MADKDGQEAFSGIGPLQYVLPYIVVPPSLACTQERHKGTKPNASEHTFGFVPNASEHTAVWSQRVSAVHLAQNRQAGRMQDRSIIYKDKPSRVRVVPTRSLSKTETNNNTKPSPISARSRRCIACHQQSLWPTFHPPLHQKTAARLSDLNPWLAASPHKQEPNR